MYYGNVSDFFFKNKDWLLKQPKFHMSKMNNKNIVKIGGKYYKLDDTTGALEMIKNDTFTQKNKSIYNYNNKKYFDSEKKNLKILPGINNKIVDSTSQSIKTSENRLQSKYHPLVSIFEENKGNNLVIDHLDIESDNENNNKANEFDLKSRLTNYMNQNNNIPNKNLISSHFGHKNKKSSLFLNTSNYFTKTEPSHTNNKEIDRSMIKNKSLNLIKNKIKDKNKKYTSMKFNLTKEWVDKNIFGYKDNNDNHIKNNNDNYSKNKDIPKNLTETELILRMFPNEEALEVKKSDNKVMANLKDKIFEYNLYDNLRKKYKFYHEKNKSCNNKIPKIKIKNMIFLFKDGYKQNSGALHRKLYFEYVNKQKKNDDVFLGLDK